MSVRQNANNAANNKLMPGGEMMTDVPVDADATLGEGVTFNTNSSENPLKRTVVVSIKASLNELCLQKQKGTWAPSAEALRSIFQQKRFTTLEGSSEAQGDLKSVVLHSMAIKHARSSFPLALGARITSVDDSTYSSTGEAFSTIVLPRSESTNEKELQSDDVSLAYEFSKKFPGYTADNLSEKGIHEVTQRHFVLVAADHPIISAISENADKLQMGEIHMMPVRDFSRAMVSISPAEYSSWPDARNELMVEAKRGQKAAMAAELAAAADESEASAIRTKFDALEREIEHQIDHAPLEMHLELGISYNFLSH